VQDCCNERIDSLHRRSQGMQGYGAVKLGSFLVVSSRSVLESCFVGISIVAPSDKQLCQTVSFGSWHVSTRYCGIATFAVLECRPFPIFFGYEFTCKLSRQFEREFQPAAAVPNSRVWNAVRHSTCGLLSGALFLPFRNVATSEESLLASYVALVIELCRTCHF
jgi:hypothetical protein